MTSPGLKRPLDYDSAGQTARDQTTTMSSGISSKNATDGDVVDAGVLAKIGRSQSPVQLDQNNGPNANGIKRRCTSMNFQTSPPVANDVTSPQATGINTNQQQQQQPMQMSPPTREHPQQQQQQTTPLDDELNALVRNELYKSQQPHIDLNNQHSNGDEKLVLTARQLRSICEKLVCDRERRLREEYDRRLACKLAEQYDLFAKANYLNTFSEPARTPPNPTLVPPSPAPAAANSHPPLTNAIAAAFMAQRSAASSLVTSATTPSNSVPNAAASMPNLTTIATTLSANGAHPGAIPSNHHLAAYNLQQHQHAAATALRLAQQHQQQQLQPQQQQQRISMSTNSLIPTGPVLLTSNLDEQLATPEALFTLFGVFGDVIRVKILFNKKDNALIQMADADRAQVAQSYLDKQRIFGKVIRVTRSKHQLVQMPRDGNQSDAGLTKDFTNSPLHRFKIPGSRNYLNIYPPSNTLHISNIPMTVEEGDLHKAFKEQCGFEFTSFKFFPKDRKMALMRFNSVEHATIALIKMHNFQIGDEHNLRVSFSKSAL